jgi:hypothetical protein
VIALRRLAAVAGFGVLLCSLVGCSNGSRTGSPGGSGSESACASGQAFDGTFDAIQEVVFERNGCTQQVCHGSSAQGGLDLSPDVAYTNLFNVPSTESRLKRIEPGDRDQSYLWLKLAAKTKPALLPTGAEVSGAPMPNGLPAISDAELEAVRMWIYSGAPRTGTVAGTETLLDACLPDPKPITIQPLDPPAPGEGVQFVMPPVYLPAHVEQEVCFATYYDVTDQVPQEMQDPSGRFFRYSTETLRQDPQSHHLTMNYPGVSVDQIHDPSFGAWTCDGGEREGEGCEPTDLRSCGSGICRSEIRKVAGCVGYGPPVSASSFIFQRVIGGAQQSQAFLELDPGVFAQIPMKGIVYWDSHAFNLTSEDHTLNGRINYIFATDQRYPVVPILDLDHIFEPDAPPYSSATYCEKHVLPQGTRVSMLTSHTHKRGKRFWVTTPDGKMVFENFIYNDPYKQRFDPPLAFDSADPADRTLTYCATYNNGLADDGSPDPDTVTRASRVPESARLTIGTCSPIACVSGQVGAACNGVGDDRTCDSAAGANDGNCDACAITGGESTENEMFILVGSTHIADGFPQPDPNDPILFGVAAAPQEGPLRDASGRSAFRGLAVPPDLGCGSSAGMHAAHVAHAH